jgi:hypothetical protein
MMKPRSSCRVRRSKRHWESAEPAAGARSRRSECRQVARRVNAADKRIINGKTDVNQLVPFKYKWAWENTWPAAPTTGCRRKSTCSATSSCGRTRTA